MSKIGTSLSQTKGALCVTVDRWILSGFRVGRAEVDRVAGCSNLFEPYNLPRSAYLYQLLILGRTPAVVLTITDPGSGWTLERMILHPRDKDHSHVIFT